MYEENRILSKIEALVDKLPYKTAEIRIQMADKTYSLMKDKQRPIGFVSSQEPVK